MYVENNQKMEKFIKIVNLWKIVKLFETVKKIFDNYQKCLIIVKSEAKEKFIKIKI